MARLSKIFPKLYFWMIINGNSLGSSGGCVHVFLSFPLLDEWWKKKIYEEEWSMINITQSSIADKMPWEPMNRTEICLIRHVNLHHVFFGEIEDTTWNGYLFGEVLQKRI